MEINFKRNTKQDDFFQVATDSLYGRNGYRHLFYGGAIRAGKTFVALNILIRAAQEFAGSRWHIFRQDFPALLATTIPSMEKVLRGCPDWTWSRDRSNCFVEYKPNGSRIYFKSENLSADPDLTDLLGLETNGILFEQIEELSMALWQMGTSRLGSWYVEPMPMPLTLATFNPTQTWVKELIYEPYRTGTLREPYYYMGALPADNSYVTAEQWAAWSRLDERYREQFIHGDWTDYTDTVGLWAFAYDRGRHVAAGDIAADADYPLYLSFDFNRNPICCSVIQHIDAQIRVIETIKLANSDIYQLCRHILSLYPGHTYLVTGDASGRNSSALVRDNVNYYTVIRQYLSLSQGQLLVPTSNPSLEENQVLVSAILTHCDVQISPHRARALIYDLQNVKLDASGGIEKHNRRDPAQQADALDTFRYYCNSVHRGYLQMKG